MLSSSSRQQKGEGPEHCQGTQVVDAREDGLSRGRWVREKRGRGPVPGDHHWGVRWAVESVGKPLPSRQTWFSESHVGNNLILGKGKKAAEGAVSWEAEAEGGA